MKRILSIILLASALLTGRATTYTITNDLASTFTMFYWTNSAGTNYQFNFVTNMPPGTVTNFFVSTNGNGGMGVYQTNATTFVLVSWTNMTSSSSFLSVMFASAMLEVAPANEQIPQTQSILRSYFITGARPKQINYWEMIDTMFYYVQIIASNAAVATAAAQQTAQLSKASLTFVIPGNAGGSSWTTLANWTNNVVVANSNNFAGMQFIGGTATSRSAGAGNVASNVVNCVVTFSQPVTYYATYIGGTTNNFGNNKYNFSGPLGNVETGLMVLSNSPNWIAFRLVETAPSGVATPLTVYGFNCQ